MVNITNGVKINLHSNDIKLVFWSEAKRRGITQHIQHFKFINLFCVTYIQRYYTHDYNIMYSLRDNTFHHRTIEYYIETVLHA